MSTELKIPADADVRYSPATDNYDLIAGKEFIGMITAPRTGTKLGLVLHNRPGTVRTYDDLDTMQEAVDMPDQVYNYLKYYERALDKPTSDNDNRNFVFLDGVGLKYAPDTEHDLLPGMFHVLDPVTSEPLGTIVPYAGDRDDMENSRWYVLVTGGHKMLLQDFDNLQQLCDHHGLPRYDLLRKGKWDGACNRKDCLMQGARWWNRSTEAYYCSSCKSAIASYPENADLFSHHLEKPLTTQEQQYRKFTELQERAGELIDSLEELRDMEAATLDFNEANIAMARAEESWNVLMKKFKLL